MSKLKDPKSYVIIRKLLGGIVRFLFRVKTKGAENIPENGVLICANHIGLRDVVLISATYPRMIRFVAKKELFSVPLLSSLIKAWGAVRVERNGGDVSAMRTSVDLMKNDNTMAIFPQGHRFPGVNPLTTPKKNGAALIAYHSGCDVLPVCINVKKNKYAPFRRVEIIYGSVIKNSELGFSGGGTEEYRNATNLIFGKIGALGQFDSLPEYTSNKQEERGKK